MNLLVTAQSHLPVHSLPSVFKPLTRCQIVLRIQARPSSTFFCADSLFSNPACPGLPRTPGNSPSLLPSDNVFPKVPLNCLSVLTKKETNLIETTVAVRRTASWSVSHSYNVIRPEHEHHRITRPVRNDRVQEGRRRKLPLAPHP